MHKIRDSYINTNHQIVGVRLWFEYFCNLLGFSHTKQSLEFSQNGLVKRNRLVLWTETPCWWKSSIGIDQTDLRWQTATVSQINTLYNCTEQTSSSECTTSQGIWAKTAEDHVGFDVYQPRTESRGCREHRLTKTEQLKTGQTQPGLMKVYSLSILFWLLPASCCTMSINRICLKLLSWTWPVS